MTYITIAYDDGKFPPLGRTDALKDASPDELRILLCLIEEGRIPKEKISELARAAGCPLARAKSAISYWREVGILTEEEGRPTERVITSPAMAAAEAKADDEEREERRLRPLAPLRDPSPLERTAAENAAVIEEKELAPFIEACEQTAGRQFNAKEINELLDIEEEFPFSHEYLLTLISYTCRRARKFTFSYLRKVAVSMLEDDCLTPEALNARLAAEERFASEEWKLRRLLGIGERKLGSRERTAFVRWTGELAYGEEIVGIAYDITVNQTGKASIAYMDKLLTRFHAAGCRTVADVEEFLEKDRAEHDARRLSRHTGTGKSGKSEKDHSFRTGVTADDPSATRGTSFNTQDYLSAALRRSYGDDGTEDGED